MKITDPSQIRINGKQPATLVKKAKMKDKGLDWQAEIRKKLADGNNSSGS